MLAQCVSQASPQRPARAVYRIVTVLFWYIKVGVYHQGPHALVSRVCVLSSLCPLINTPGSPVT